MSVRDAGLAMEEILALELGLLISDSELRFGRGLGPYESLLMPDVLSLGTWLLPEMDEVIFVGVVSSPATYEPVVRFLERIVTVDGTTPKPLGEALGGVLVGAGSLDRADWTLASRRCICAVRDRMCVRELEAGILYPP